LDNLVKYKPNIIFIMADDMGYGDLGCYGATKIPTPNIDKLAAEGVRFTDAHSASSLCTPSRYAVLTGRYCWRTHLKRGVHGGFDLPLIDSSRMTVASLLKKYGYSTAAIGKWHLGLKFQAKDGEKFDPKSWVDEGKVDYYKFIIGGPVTLGFDYFFGISGSLDMPPYCFIKNDKTLGIPSEEKNPYNVQQKKGFMVPGWKDEDVDVHHLNEAVKFIETHSKENKNKPFFLYLTPSAPHRPCTAPDFIKGRSQAGPRGDLVTVVDWMVGGIMDALNCLGISDNTLLIVTSDNGAQPCDVDGNTYGHKSCGDLRGYKSDIWDGGHREPFIARWPERIKPGTTSGELICLSDLMATCAAIVGDELPYNAGEDSYNILPALLGQIDSSPIREAVVHHSGCGMFSIRQGKWKVILGRGNGSDSGAIGYKFQKDDFSGQLYNIEKDLGETNNLWDKHPEVIKRLESLLDKYKYEGRSRGGNKLNLK
jgi:arylsulfatase A-like enzyme